MFRTIFPRISTRSFASMASQSATPMEDTIRSKVTEAFNPTKLEIFNDSHKHAHHAPMAGVTSKETHFRLNIVSSAFASKMPAARHRMVYALLADEMKQDFGIHALQLTTRTPEEAERLQQKAT